MLQISDRNIEFTPHKDETHILDHEKFLKEETFNLAHWYDPPTCLCLSVFSIAASPTTCPSDLEGPLKGVVVCATSSITSSVSSEPGEENGTFSTTGTLDGGGSVFCGLTALMEAIVGEKERLGGSLLAIGNLDICNPRD